MYKQKLICYHVCVNYIEKYTAIGKQAALNQLGDLDVAFYDQGWVSMGYTYLSSKDRLDMGGTTLRTKRICTILATCEHGDIAGFRVYKFKCLDCKTWNYDIHFDDNSDAISSCQYCNFTFQY